MTSSSDRTVPQGGERSDRPRIFGIGLNKTATSSLHEALTLLGYRSLHHGGPEAHNAVKAAFDTGRPLLSNLDQTFDAFSDIGFLSRRFGYLDRQYPGSRFVLTVRPVDEWVDSRRRHVQRNIERSKAGKYDGTFLVIDEERWHEEWRYHMQRVHDYFGDRRDLLEVDLTRNPSWEHLCELLGVQEPDDPFPWANRDRAIHDA